MFDNIKAVFNFTVKYALLFPLTYTGCLRPSIHLLSWKQSKRRVWEKNVSDKSSGILNDPFSDLIILTFDGVTKVQYHFEFFK